MARQSRPRKAVDREPTLEEWHEVLTEILDPNWSISQQTVEYFLRNSESGRAYLEGAKRLRPSLDIGINMDLDEVISTYDAMTLLGKLIAEPRCGKDPEFWVWKDIWQDSSVGASGIYAIAIEIAQELEARCEKEEERARLRQVRAALENEFSLEKRFDEYREFRREDNKRISRR